jgi:hypothetical protein
MSRAMRSTVSSYEYCKAVTAALDEPSSLLPDLIERGPELGPGCVNLMEFPPRFARSERDEEAAAQAGHLRMIAKPTDGLLVCLAAARAGNLDLGIIERAFGHEASLFGKAKPDSMTSPSYAVYVSPSDSDLKFHGPRAYQTSGSTSAYGP